MFLPVFISSLMFTDRKDAGMQLAQLLKPHVVSECKIIGLARGGVVVAETVSQQLRVPLDVLVVKKIPSPQNPELALGALAPDGIYVVNWPSAHRSGMDEQHMNEQIAVLSRQIRQRIELYRHGRKPFSVQGKTVVLVDDGVATGATLEAAILWARKKHAKRIIAAMPVVPVDILDKIRPETDAFIAVETPHEMNAVGEFYREFSQITDAEVIRLLSAHKTD